MDRKQTLSFAGAWNLHGIPNDSVKRHLELYQGYVTRFNHVREDLLSASGEAKSGLLGEMNINYDGARLHEYYFEQFVPGGVSSRSNAFWAEAERCYGTLDEWRRSLYSICHTPGPGWAITYYVPELGCVNAHVRNHSDGVLAGGCPLLVIDLWEHAYYCWTNKMAYVGDVLANIDWNIVDHRLRMAGAKHG